MFALGNRPITGRKHHKSSGDRRRLREVRAAYQSRLRFEPLEDRCLLSITYTVTTAGDAIGLSGSLRQAISDANNHAGADKIQFAANVTGTIALTAGELQITDSLTIQGPGAASLAIESSAGWPRQSEAISG